MLFTPFQSINLLFFIYVTEIVIKTHWQRESNFQKN